MTEQPPNAVNGSLADRRKRIGLTQQQVADELGLARSMISMIETGQVVPRLIHCHGFARLYECGLLDILSDIGQAG